MAENLANTQTNDIQTQVPTDLHTDNSADKSAEELSRQIVADGKDENGAIEPNVANTTNSRVEEQSDTHISIPEEESEKGRLCEPQDTAEEQEEKTSDTPDENERAVYESEGWQEKVEEFFKTYPVAKGFASMIGEQIVSDAQLCKDERCLEKALLRVFDKVYVPPKDLVRNQEFLEKYVYEDETIKNAIVERYLETLEKSRPPKAISSRGKITLTPPDRPKSIAEAGSLIKSMLKNRRI